MQKSMPSTILPRLSTPPRGHHLSLLILRRKGRRLTRGCKQARAPGRRQCSTFPAVKTRRFARHNQPSCAQAGFGSEGTGGIPPTRSAGLCCSRMARWTTSLLHTTQRPTAWVLCIVAACTSKRTRARISRACIALPLRARARGASSSRAPVFLNAPSGTIPYQRADSGAVALRLYDDEITEALYRPWCLCYTTGIKLLN